MGARMKMASNGVAAGRNDSASGCVNDSAWRPQRRQHAKRPELEHETNLATPLIPDDLDVDATNALVPVFAPDDLLAEQDHPRTGAPDRAPISARPRVRGKLSQRLEQAGLLREERDRGRLAAGDDERRDERELGRCADLGEGQVERGGEKGQQVQVLRKPACGAVRIARSAPVTRPSAAVKQSQA